MLIRQTFLPKCDISHLQLPTAQLSQRDRFWTKVEDWNCETIFYGHYRSVVNHGDIIGLQSYRIRWKTQNKGYYAVQGHSRSSRSVPIESPYATCY